MESSEDLGHDGLEMVEMGPGWWKKRFGKRADTRHFLEKEQKIWRCDTEERKERVQVEFF